uniref:Uncharacterized protein n=1 Tax=Globodera pallida TaxID=36090 RepID=A0A183CIA0_GLOPA
MLVVGLLGAPTFRPDDISPTARILQWTFRIGTRLWWAVDWDVGLGARGYRYGVAREQCARGRTNRSCGDGGSETGPHRGLRAWRRIVNRRGMEETINFGSMSRDRGEAALFQRPYSSKLFKREGGGRYSQGQPLILDFKSFQVHAGS